MLGTVRAMASDVHLYGAAPRAEDPVIDNALGVFTQVHETCTRFDDASPLMTINAEPDRWHEVPRVLWVAVGAAYAAYLESDGRFDPRVFNDLQRLGYNRSLPFALGGVTTVADLHPRQSPGRWRPHFRPGSVPTLHLDGSPIDLGGIGKGLAVRWATDVLDGHLADFVLDAGGDGACRGRGPDGRGWTIGIEHPLDVERPLAVLELVDRAYATSSIRLRQWTSGNATLHHLIDPHHGLPGGAGMASVTVVADDPADAEVLAKTLFLAGSATIAAEAARRDVAALWVTDAGAVGTSAAMEQHLLWRGW